VRNGCDYVIVLAAMRPMSGRTFPVANVVVYLYSGDEPEE
jgi:hypothetical protein